MVVAHHTPAFLPVSVALPRWLIGHQLFNFGDLVVVAALAALLYRNRRQSVAGAAPRPAPRERISGRRPDLVFDGIIICCGLALVAISLLMWLTSGGSLGVDELAASALVVLISRFPFVLPHRAGDVVIGFEASVAVFLALIDRPWQALALWSVGTALAQGTNSRKLRTRLFNIGLTAMGGACLIGVVAIGQALNLSLAAQLVSVLVGCALYFLLDLFATAASLALEAHSKLGEALRWRAVPIALLCFVAVDTIGYLAALLRERQANWTLVLLLVPVVTILVAVRSVSRSRLAEQRLTGLFEAARQAPEWPDEGAAEVALLEQVRRVLRHSEAELRDEPPGSSEMGTTFEVDGRPARYLVVHRTAEADWFDDEDRKALETITAVAVTSINRRRLADEMFHLARHDALTGLYNRAVFASRLDQALDSPRQGRAPAVLYCDLDGFKTVNDRLGHDAGDRLLLAVAERIRAALRPEDMAARLGGDEFAILLDAADPGMAEQVAERLLEALRAHFLVDGAAAHLSASIGIVYAAGERRGVDLLSKADTAMYRAKAHGKDRAELFLPEMRAEDLHRLHLEDALRDAVHRRLIKHALQPIVELGTGRIVGFEALARWHDADLGNVPPDVFIPAAERLGLVGQLGSQILEEAHLLARMMRDQAGRPFGIWINLAPSQVVDPLLAARVAELIRQNPDIPIVLELTERSVLTDDQRTTRALTALSAAGATLALDDFGVGYSSIGYLQRFPVEIIKVDKTFMQNLADPHGLALVQAILAMALALDLEVVAEGLESWPACATMRRLGTTLGQGHLFAKPLSSQQALLLAQVGEVDVTTLDNVEVLSAGPRGRTAPGRALRGV